MKVSELISYLEAAKSEYGDIEVSTGSCEDSPITDVWFDNYRTPVIYVG